MLSGPKSPLGAIGVVVFYDEPGHLFSWLCLNLGNEFGTSPIMVIPGRGVVCRSAIRRMTTPEVTVIVRID
jgi:hypothetical protein